MKRFLLIVLVILLGFYISPAGEVRGREFEHPKVAALDDDGLRTMLVSRDIVFHSRIANSDGVATVRWGSALFNENGPASNNEQYCNDLATVLMALSAAAYDGNHIYDGLSTLGFGDIELYHYLGHPQNQTLWRMGQFNTGFTLGHRMMTINDEPRAVIVVVVRGSASFMDWVRNMQLSPFNHDIHYGFYGAAAEAQSLLQHYMERHGLLYTADSNMLLLTGHSLGGATANILARQLTKTEVFAPASRIYAYTFATPNTALASLVSYEQAYENIFNIIFRDDPVTAIPPSGWYRKFGTTLIFPTERVNRNDYLNIHRDNFTREFKVLTGIDRESIAGAAIIAAYAVTGFFHHYPEVYLAWLQTIEPQYSETTGLYVRINDTFIDVEIFLDIFTLITTRFR